MDLKSSFYINNYYLENYITLDKKDKEKIRKWRNSKNIRRWMFNDHIISREEHQKFIKGLENNDENFYWLVRSSEEKLGSLYLESFDKDNKNTYFGFYANPQKIGSGIALVFNKIVKKLAFKKLNLHTLKCKIIEGNEVIKIQKRMGFSIEGRLKEFILKDGEWKDVIIVGIINYDG